MTNTNPGASSLIANGEKFVMRLTLGALSEIESGLGIKNLADLGKKLTSVNASDLAVLAAALLRGGGHDVTPADVMRLPTDIGSIIAAVTDALSAIGVTKTAPLAGSAG
jgi:hypothetical protein